MAAKNKTATAPNPREFALTRVFDAPRQLVFDVWTDPEQLAQWWGPRGFTNPVCKIDVRPGGAIRIDMRGPDGTVYPMSGVYREVVEPERLVFTSIALDEGGKPLFENLNTITFAERDGKTTLSLHTRVLSATAKGAPYLEGMAEGWTMTVDRLEEHVADAEKAAGHDFVISRVFDAPRKLVWQAWTEAEHLKKWFGPKGCTISSCTLDLRPGGIFHFCMKTPDGHEMWGKWVFREIAPPEKLVLINSFSDSKGGVTRHPMSPTWPMETLSTTTLAESGGKTTLTIRWRPHAATEVERKTFDTSHESMQQGWTGTFDQLAEYLLKIV